MRALCAMVGVGDAPLLESSSVLAPSTQQLLTEWSWEPSVVLGILAFTCLFLYAVGPYRRRHDLGPPISRGKMAWFIASDLVLIVALLSPIDEIGDRYLFSVHMVQHLLLAGAWPVFILLALPGWLVRPLLQKPFLGALIQFCTVPAIAIAIFNADLVFWHIPVLYDLTLANEAIHIIEHLTFLAFGVVAFWPVLNPMVERRLAYPFQVLYLFVSGMVMMVLGIVFTFSPIVFYSPYAAAPRLWAISAISDQQLGGLIMWYPGNLAYAVLLVVAFYRWFDGDEIVPAERSAYQPQTHTIGPPLS
jgi:putative membrane protein